MVNRRVIGYRVARLIKRKNLPDNTCLGMMSDLFARKEPPLSQLIIDLGKHTMPTIEKNIKQGAYQGASEEHIRGYVRMLGK